jgi:hypothetical protein
MTGTRSSVSGHSIRGKCRTTAWSDTTAFCPSSEALGFGARQLDEVVRRLAKLGAHKVRATTGEHPFFLPARKMYLAGG